MEKIPDLKYVPAIPAGFFEKRPEYNLRTKFSESFWEEHSPYSYKRFLVTAYFFHQFENFRKDLRIPDDVNIIGDSGGFQNATIDGILNPIKVLRWQETNCQIGLTFDFPFLKDDNAKTRSTKQLKTVQNAYLAAKHRKKRADFKLFAVLQGQSYDELINIIKMYETMGNIEEFDGFAIGGLVPLAGNTALITQIITTFTHLMSKHNKPLHYFGLSGKDTIPIILYLSSKLPFEVTFDSSSYVQNTLNRQYKYDYNRNAIEFTKVDGSNATKLPCLCPICSNYMLHEIKDIGPIGRRSFLMHNLYQTLSYVHMLESLLTDRKDFVDFVKRNNGVDVLKYFSIIDETFKGGLDFILKNKDMFSVEEKGRQVKL